MSREALLVIIALAFYLYDSLLFLSTNEAMLIRRPNKKWLAVFGADFWRLAAKEPYLPNPLTPWRPEFRVSWILEGAPRAAPAAPVQVPDGLGGLAALVIASAICLFGLLLAGLFWLGAAVTLPAAGLIYGINLTIVVVLWMRRRRLRLATRAVVAIAFECLMCPPFALNVIRKICHRQTFDEDFTVAAARLLAPAALIAVHAGCLARIDEQIDHVPESGAQADALRAARARFLPEAEVT